MGSHAGDEERKAECWGGTERVLNGVSYAGERWLGVRLVQAAFSQRNGGGRGAREERQARARRSTWAVPLEPVRKKRKVGVGGRGCTYRRPFCRRGR